MSEPKAFYKNYIADDNLSDLSYELYRLITELKPGHVFELGCGSGKNLKAFQMQGIVTCGLDISPMNIIRANARNDLPFVIIGDDSHLGHLANFDVAFTCSVLDHIENIDKIIEELKRLAKTVFLAEATLHNPELFYWNHDYSKYGFNTIETFDDESNEYRPFEWTGQDQSTYHIWKYSY